MNAKKILFAGVCLLAACFTQAQEESQSQMPKAFSYQAVVRDNAGKVVADKVVGVKIEILKGSAESGTVVYEETLTPKSTKTGTVNLMIGNGNATQFAAIDWGGNAHFLRISLSLDGGEYKVVSTTQMLPVPYALYAEKAGSVVNGGTGGSTEPGTPADGEIKYGRDFILSPTDWDLFTGELFAAVGSGMLEDIKEGGIGRGTEFEFNILYLTGTDLKLNAKIDGFEQELNDYHISESTVLGRYFHFIIQPTLEQTQAGQLQTTLSIINEQGEKIISFPITIKYVEEKS